MTDHPPTNVDPNAARTIAELLQRNRNHAATNFSGFRPIAPSLRTIVVGCVDPRVDPAHVLGLDTGEAVVIRNVAGRVTPHFFQEMLMLRLVAQADGNEPGSGWNLVVLHHTDCGITRLSHYPDLLAGYFGVVPGDLDQVHPNDPYVSVRHDVDVLRANPYFPPQFTVTGVVYDVHSGLVNLVTPPQSIHPTQIQPA